ncbi:MAG: hypothetical protein IT481_05880 [Gammaproteobacteria bacterium]|nr:hypothetical protein [Gammaproteobacteria bacterium]
MTTQSTAGGEDAAASNASLSVELTAVPEKRAPRWGPPVPAHDPEPAP